MQIITSYKNSLNKFKFLKKMFCLKNNYISILTIWNFYRLSIGMIAENKLDRYFCLI